MSCPKQGQLWDHTRLLRAFHQLLKTCKDRHITKTETSQPLWTMVKMFSLISSLNPFLNFCLVSPVVPPRTTVKSLGPSSWWPPHMYWGASRPLITPQSCLFPQTEQALILHPLLTGQVQPQRQPLTAVVAIRWTHPSLRHWEVFRQKIPSTNILLSAKKKDVKMFLFCFVLKICIFFILVGSQLPFP